VTQLPPPARPRVIQVIESERVRGCGGSNACRMTHQHEVVRLVVQYYSLDGAFLAERDDVPPAKRACE
jgi:hypothetical protein